MNRFLIPLVMLVAVVSFFVGTVASSSWAQPVTGQQWEYLMITVDGTFSYNIETGEFVEDSDAEWYRELLQVAARDDTEPSHFMTAKFAYLGSDGWEFVSTIADSSMAFLVFKRPKAAG